MKVPRPGADPGGQVVEALEAIDDEVDDLAGAVDAALDEEEDAVAGDGAVALVGPGVNDEVGGAGLVLEGDEDDPLGGGGALADEDHAGDRDAGALGAAGLVEGISDLDKATMPLPGLQRILEVVSQELNACETQVVVVSV